MPRNNSVRHSTYLLVALIVVDTILILLHTFHRLTVRGLITSDLFRSELLSMSVPGQLPDVFQYAQELAIVILLLSAFIIRERLAYAIWAVAFSYILVDDIFELHERVGYYLAQSLDFPEIIGLPPGEVGQMLFLAVMGLILFTVAILLILTHTGQARQVSVSLTLLLLAGAFFGVGVDLVQGFVMEIRGISGLVKITEDGGEMLIMALGVWYTYRLAFEEVPDFRFVQRFIGVRPAHGRVEHE